MDVMSTYCHLGLADFFLKYFFICENFVHCTHIKSSVTVAANKGYSRIARSTSCGNYLFTNMYCNKQYELTKQSGNYFKNN